MIEWAVYMPQRVVRRCECDSQQNFGRIRFCRIVRRLAFFRRNPLISAERLYSLKMPKRKKYSK
eukprot:762885-Amorphochlora_amoeboformis.AAC.1